MLDISVLNKTSKSECDKILLKINVQLESFTAEDRIIWALENLPSVHALSSSFGIQSAVCLHLVTSIKPNIPVILIDTGYLFSETYQFIDELVEKFKLNLHIFRSNISPAWQEARYGKLWQQGLKGIEKYNKINKINPMNNALRSLNINSWFAGLRRSQSKSRSDLSILTIQRDTFKILPIIDWDNRQVHYYLKKHHLKYHPLWDKGYLSLGDIHTTSIWEPGMTEEDTRFFGIKRECGIHE
ncbi:phosphoadenosine phosphosulfate reductase [Candidatus Pantoea edessiphila]|uniref:Phosphoadenosine 5'-phosphosulfate reductase n=1 Tax=Candidatus Pantoea edessiphila TaxID=2044610 RepID=A0A2P5SXM2_9GAMM|nr:phosphoadenylyl-sulfate reductase [Candidatus Pantoea edessiphila]MBK4775683.1 phosphoadenylyl-sulfate reductase [Pantoea sp. Edef]PPI87086.1 phosphoadenosine phosphosulfate reductase [Candidatus Pantoea edessiphila]